MSTSEVEYDALSKIAKTEQRNRLVVYIIGIVALVLLVGFAIMVFTAEQRRQKDFENLLEEIKDITAQRLKETEEQNNQTRRYITCMFVLPINARSEEAQQKCIDESIQGKDKFSQSLSLGNSSSTYAGEAPNLLDGNVSSPSNNTPQSSQDVSNSSQETENTQAAEQTEPAPQPTLLDRILKPVTNLSGGNE